MVNGIVALNDCEVRTGENIDPWEYAVDLEVVVLELVPVLPNSGVVPSFEFGWSIKDCKLCVICACGVAFSACSAFLARS